MDLPDLRGVQVGQVSKFLTYSCRKGRFRKIEVTYKRSN